MAGIMNKECFSYRSLLTEHLLLGMPLPRELVRHLDQCPDCAREASEVDDVVRILQQADPLAGMTGARASAAHARPSKDLRDRIRREVTATQSASRPRLRRRRRIALGLAVVCATAAAVIIPFAAGQDQPPPATSVVLVRQGRMVEHPWGTEVPVALSGLKTGETYRVMTVNAAGTRLSGGSVRAATAEPVTFRMVTAMRKDTITALIVEDAEGRVVTRVPVGTFPST
ncbi:hypothetical protein [Streptomyces malaysiensis]|uniref:hypothetical protein n=1 Tax=Streptomyces malaysiensis TaxID=92644 RepID=UPI0036BC1659